MTILCTPLPRTPSTNSFRKRRIEVLHYNHASSLNPICLAVVSGKRARHKKRPWNWLAVAGSEGALDRRLLLEPVETKRC